MANGLQLSDKEQKTSNRQQSDICRTYILSENNLSDKNGLSYNNRFVAFPKSNFSNDFLETIHILTASAVPLAAGFPAFAGVPALTGTPAVLGLLLLCWLSYFCELPCSCWFPYCCRHPCWLGIRHAGTVVDFLLLQVSLLLQAFLLLFTSLTPYLSTLSNGFLHG